MARAAIQIARPLRLDPATTPIIDARLADGSRVAICGPPAAPSAAIRIRRFGGRAFTIDELSESGVAPRGGGRRLGEPRSGAGASC